VLLRVILRKEWFGGILMPGCQGDAVGWDSGALLALWIS